MDVLYLNISSTVFYKKKDDWVKEMGFPKPHPVLSAPRKPLYDRKLLDKWIDKMGGIKSQEESYDDLLIERARSGEF